ncbi:DUF2333 family protein [Salinicola sp. JS01]|uniref:DUF2333 family protein n=1 Tax=Salinicola sp. JS01 TaxID=3050071 RepID=UPI00255BFE42|nr:DUF2333 family protein [Salinicola sp. JS01]WIX34181.1 DUF2333 family protein [Salinicola sp. JS01]
MALFRKKAPLSRTEVLETPQYGWIWKPLVALVAIYLLICIVLGIWWSWTPSPVDPRQAVALQRGVPESAGDNQQAAIKPGEALLATNIELLDALLDKPGGYLRNDVMPPGLWLDNMPNWEAGVTQQVQDSVALLGSALAVGQAPLKAADEALAGDLDSWRWPESETLLRAARNNLGEAFSALDNSGAGTPTQDAAASTPAQAPSALDADTLKAWLAQVQSQLETQTQALAASVGRSPGGGQAVESTPWFRIDNVFFKTRGTTWALLQLVQAARIDYAEAIEQAGQGEAFDQLIAELKASQARVWSPVILNGSGFGFFANHSLMMANYTVRAAQLIGQIRSAL